MADHVESSDIRKKRGRPSEAAALDTVNWKLNLAFLWCCSFSAVTLLVGWQEGHLGCRKTSTSDSERYFSTRSAGTRLNREWSSENRSVLVVVSIKPRPKSAYERLVWWHLYVVRRLPPQSPGGRDCAYFSFAILLGLFVYVAIYFPCICAV